MSKPSLSAYTNGPTNYVFAVAQGPNNSLVEYSNTGGSWTVAQSNFQTTFAAPDASVGMFYAEGAGNDMDNWYQPRRVASPVTGRWPRATRPTRHPRR